MQRFALSGKVALVTGGNGGIGLGIAQGLAEAGADIAIVGRNSDKNATAVARLAALGARARAIVADVAKPEDCRAMVEEAVAAFGGLDILVCNAGTNIRKQPQDYAPEEWRLILDTNLSSVWFSCLAAYPELKKRGRGKIITIGSMMSLFGASFAGPYAASKGGVVQLTRALATAWAKDNIQVNAILPGWIDTELTRRARRDVPGLEERVVQRTPAGRWGTPEDFCGIAVFLASAASDFVTGTAIPVDGGYSVQG
ncbi:2-dehydro-3-deoxy-D-gluconate 5-dehydrogenase [bacterium HR40]|nr:2-dehydro-3-deoxy-D-gluconate 5-dehydrogenase [bacterium HR40]